MISAYKHRGLLRAGGSLFVGFLLLFSATGLLSTRSSPSNPGRQPIAFNHSKPVANGMECVDCHVGARDQQRAGIPSITHCVTCHESALTESDEEKRLRSIAAAGAELAWRPVTHLPGHVFFSHRRHVALAGLSCDTCHGSMERLTQPPQVPLRPLTMASCIDCHTRKKAGNDCNDCHR